ncbi:enolase C-terminal domain-like protein, partial [Escherichia coli]|uniref:enolase C-terminal domain-like protein n=1 Tax=Escherichia coli TaxID=562 RepID=UPI002811DB67
EPVLARYPGVSTFKIKVAEKGQSLDDDLRRVAAVRQLRPDATLRVDANRGWSVDEAVEAAERLGELEYIEQPCATVEELA